MNSKGTSNKSAFPCPHRRQPINGEDGWKHCPHCLGMNPSAQDPRDEALKKQHELDERLEKAAHMHRPAPADRSGLEDVINYTCEDSDIPTSAIRAMYHKIEALITQKETEAEMQGYNNGINTQNAIFAALQSADNKIQRGKE